MDIIIVLGIISVIFFAISMLTRGHQRTVGGGRVARRPTAMPRFKKKKKKPLTNTKDDAKNRLDSI